MASILFKWCCISFISVLLTGAATHPIFVSVTEIEHNAKDKTLEISCRIFTDDFEKTLRGLTGVKVDLLKPVDRKAMDRLVEAYVQKHLKVSVGGKLLVLKYIGYEQAEEAIASYYQAENVAVVNEITVQDNILFESKPQQISLVHITVNGNRKSTKLTNPEDKVTISF